MSTWQIIDLDPFAAARAGLPAQVAVPTDVDPAAVTPVDLARYGAEYAEVEPAGPLASDLRRLVAKQRPVAEVQQALAERRWADALAAVEEVLAIDPQDAPAHLNRAAALRESGEPKAALAEKPRLKTLGEGVSSAAQSVFARAAASDAMLPATLPAVLE
jgi:hypothetical protein